LNLVAGGRYDHFNQFGGIWTYRFAGSYRLAPTDTIVHASVATGFSPPSSQDKIFGSNFGLEPEEDLGWEAGIEQYFWERRVKIAATWFHNDLTNLIGFNGLFDTLNLGEARTQGSRSRIGASPAQQPRFFRQLHLSRCGKNFLRPTSPSYPGRASHGDRGTNSTFRARTSGLGNCARQRKRSSSARARS
jgi:hypothetical protein